MREADAKESCVRMRMQECMPVHGPDQGVHFGSHRLFIGAQVFRNCLEIARLIGWSSRDWIL